MITLECIASRSIRVSTRREVYRRFGPQPATPNHAHDHDNIEASFLTAYSSDAMDFFHEYGGDPLKPSLFELVAQEQLRDLLQPALKYVLSVSLTILSQCRALTDVSL